MTIEKYKDWEIRYFKQCDQKLIVNGRPELHIDWYCARAIKQLGPNKEYWFNTQASSSEQAILMAKRKIDEYKHYS